jgi:hypothetical protein
MSRVRFFSWLVEISKKIINNYANKDMITSDGDLKNKPWSLKRTRVNM